MKRKMPQKTGIVMIAAGAVLILAALLLLLYNNAVSERAGRESDAVMDGLRAAIAQREQRKSRETVPDVTTAPDTAAPEADVTSDTTAAVTTDAETEPAAPRTEMTVVTVNGHGYIGYIEIPAISLSLPVMAEWSDERLKITPCRHFGATWTDDLVIAGHNYRRHFASLKKLVPGDGVSFTDMDGNVIAYAVTETAVMQPTAVDAVQNSGHDLVLYTCTYSGDTRTVVFCDRTEPT
ncbi:MAG: sortase [Clostridia bacterium]|nr:sortase [Clostridia bacterium]